MKKVIIAAFVLVAIIVGINVIGFAGEAASVVREEVSPRAVQEKYEWFKRSKAAMDARLASIEVFKSQIEAVRNDYPNPTDRPRDIRTEMNQWRREVAGIVASYNTMASEYNSQHAMWNYAFADFGTLPAGVTDTLPRTFGEYRYTF